MGVFPELLDLPRRHWISAEILGSGRIGQLTSREREHANLRFDVTPLARSLELDEGIVEGRTHGDDTVCHSLDLGQPDVR